VHRRDSRQLVALFDRSERGQRLLKGTFSAADLGEELVAPVARGDALFQGLLTSWIACSSLWSSFSRSRRRSGASESSMYKPERSARLTSPERLICVRNVPAGSRLSMPKPAFAHEYRDQLLCPFGRAHYVSAARRFWLNHADGSASIEASLGQASSHRIPARTGKVA
jgi:hypothetical protein